MSASNVVYPTSASNLDLGPGDYIVLARNGDGGSFDFLHEEFKQDGES